MPKKGNNEPNMTSPFSPELGAIMRDDPAYNQLGDASYSESKSPEATAGIGEEPSGKKSSPNYPKYL